MAELVPGADPVSKISIIPRGIAALGYTTQLPTEDRYLMTRSELLARIDVLLGGRVAEEIIFGDVSTGAQNDLQRATEIARTMITQYGMSEKLGLASLEGPRRATFLMVPTQSRQRVQRGNRAADRCRGQTNTDRKRIPRPATFCSRTARAGGIGASCCWKKKLSTGRPCRRS